MSDYDERVKQTLINACANNQYNNYIGIEFIELNKEHSLCRFKLKDAILNPYGFLHGGAVLSAADICAGVTACLCGYYVVTVSCNMNFLNPGANTEYIYCECERLRGGEHILVYDVKLKDDNGLILDSGEYSYFKTERKVCD